MTASLFGITGAMNVSGTIVPEVFTATASQTLFTITKFTYTLGTNSLVVWKNGLKLVYNVGYTETSTSSFTLLSPAASGDKIEVWGVPATTLNSDASALRLDLASSLAGKGASQVALQDAAGNFPTDNVEAALAASAARTYGAWVTSPVYGAVGDGTTDDAAAFSAAMTANAGKVIYVPHKSAGYKIGSALTIPANTTLWFESRWTTPLLHAFNGDFITMSDGARIVNGWLKGQGATFTGKGLVFGGTDGRQDVRHLRVDDFSSACIDFAVAAGSQSTFHDVRTSRNNGGTGTNNFAIVISPTQQLSAVPRKFSHIETDGACSFDFGGCNDTFVTASFLGDLKYTADTRGTHITATRVANQAALTVNGHGNTIVACDIAPAITIASGADGITIGPNAYNNLPVVDNSGNGLNLVYHWWSSYTPTLTSGGTAPSLGNGSINAKWSRQGNEVRVVIDLVIGSTTNLGTGDLRFSLPTPCSFSIVQVCGNWLGNRAGVISTAVVQLASNGTFVTMQRDTSGPVTFNSPAIWAAGDPFRLSFSYLV